MVRRGKMKENILRSLLRVFTASEMTMEVARGKPEGIAVIYLADADVSLVFSPSGDLMTAKKGLWEWAINS
jgi:hypothetical protein